MGKYKQKRNKKEIYDLMKELVEELRVLKNRETEIYDTVFLDAPDIEFQTDAHSKIRKSKDYLSRTVFYMDYSLQHLQTSIKASDV